MLINSVFDKLNRTSDLKIKEENEKLIIEFKWFSYAAFWLMFGALIGFVFFWNAFVALFSFESSSSSIVFGVLFCFPVWGCIKSFYQGLAILLNTTIITVSQDTISIKHTPLPWRGSKTVSLTHINQFFVKPRRIRRYDYYEFHAQKSNQKKSIKIIGPKVIEDLETLQLLEWRVEDFLGIQDTHTKGEVKPKYQRHPKQLSQNPTNLKVKTTEIKYPKKPRNSTPNPINIKVEDLSKGCLLDYELQTWEVIFMTQYDWKGGNTGKLFQLCNEKNETMLLFVQQEKTKKYLWIEENLAYSQLKSQKAYFKNDLRGNKSSNLGKFFTSKDTNSVPIKQLSYMSQDEKKSLRILQVQRCKKC